VSPRCHWSRRDEEATSRRTRGPSAISRDREPGEASPLPHMNAALSREIILVPK